MQTYSVRLPYQYDQSGTGLFDTGKRQQAPMLEYFYGLTYLDPEQTVADLFITGRNFHPTLTHVVIGGSEKHSADTDVEVISRELIKVRLGNLRKTLSNDGSFEVRVSTPAGISNLLVIDQKKSEPPKDEKSIYDFAGTIELSGTISCNSEPKMNCCSVFCIDSGLGDLRIVTKPSHSFSHPNGKISLNLQRVRTGSDTVPLGTTNGIPLANSNLEFKSLIDAISPLIENRTDYQNGDVIVASGSLEFPGSSESPVNMTSQIKIKIRLGTCSGTKDCNSPSGEENLPAPNDQSGVMFPERLRVAPRLQYNSIR